MGKSRVPIVPPRVLARHIQSTLNSKECFARVNLSSDNEN
jgi:hypothetical protein